MLLVYLTFVPQLCCVLCPCRDPGTGLARAGRDEEKAVDGHTEIAGIGGLGSLIEKPLHRRCSACLLYRVEQAGRAIAYSKG